MLIRNIFRGVIQIIIDYRFIFRGKRMRPEGHQQLNTGSYRCYPILLGVGRSGVNIIVIRFHQ